MKKQASSLISVLSPSAEVIINLPTAMRGQHPCKTAHCFYRFITFVTAHWTITVWPLPSWRHLIVLKVCQLFYFHPLKEKRRGFSTSLPRIKNCVGTLQSHPHPPPQPPSIFYDTQQFILNNLTKCRQNKNISMEPETAICVSSYCMLSVFKQTAPLHS